MHKLAAIVVDDEAPARQRLCRLLRARPELIDIVGEAPDAESAERLIESKPVDLVFLDIVLPGMDGISLASRLGKRPMVVFVSGHSERAVEAFETNALHFLVKPVEESALDRVLDKVRSSHPPRYRTRIPCKVRDRVDLVPVSQVLAFEADNKYTAVRSISEGSAAADYLIDLPLVALEQALDPEAFVRASRSALVNIGKLAGFTPLEDGRAKLHFKDVPQLTIVASRRHAWKFREF